MRLTLCDIGKCFNFSFPLNQYSLALNNLHFLYPHFLDVSLRGPLYLSGSELIGLDAHSLLLPTDLS